MVNTQQKIIEAAIEVFNEDGSAALEKVAVKANVTRRTLHRYFKDRSDLISLCEKNMELTCKKAMIDALNSSEDPMKQLENMLYAGIDCGAKYAFFHRLHQREGHLHHQQNKDCADFDYINLRFGKLIALLQDKHLISRSITPEWMQMLHIGIVVATVNATAAGSVARVNLKKFAWFSFLKGIGG